MRREGKDRVYPKKSIPWKDFIDLYIYFYNDFFGS